MKRYKQIYKKIGFYEKSTDAEDVKKFRPQLLRTICELGDTDCLSKAATEFNKHDTIDRYGEVVFCANNFGDPRHEES